MSIEIERTYTCNDLSLQETVQRTLDFFQQEGYRLVSQEDGLYFRGGKRGIRMHPKNYWRDVQVYFHTGLAGTKIRMRYTVAYPRSLVDQTERLYWELEWRALRAVLAGESIPDWKTAYNACLDKYKLIMIVVAFIVSVFNFFVLGRCISWLSARVLLVFPSRSLVWPAVWSAIFEATATFMWLVLLGFLFVTLIPLRKDAEQLWKEAQGETRPDH